MKFALIALLALPFTSCSDKLYSHREEFSPSKAKGPWHDLRQTVRDGRDPADPSKRELFGPPLH